MTQLAALTADAFLALRQHPLRSLLSVLGLVIGVAALVAILALADGMERYARDQIGTTTNLQNIRAAPGTMQMIDGVMVRREEVVVPTPADAARLSEHLGASATVALVQQRSVQLAHDTLGTAANLVAATASIWSLREFEVEAGRLFSESDAGEGVAVVLSHTVAARLGAPAGTLLGQRVVVGGTEAVIVGVLADDGSSQPLVFGSYALSADTESRPPTFEVRAERAEEVERVAGRLEEWLAERYGAGAESFTIMTDASRAAQVRQGMTIFKIIFGLITGISVVVGGVGVMNVLLVTVTERTREIGIRKAVGARRRDILQQFLAEAMTVSGVGSFLGMVVGLLAVFAVGPLIQHFAGAPFQPALTGWTVVVVGVVALAVGLLFGTYPALRAARLSPVEAMRQE